MPKLTLDNISIDGEAVSGIGSALALTEMGICLDIGVATPAALKCGTVLITHGHVDHMSGIVRHANIRSMMGGQKSRYIVPSHLVDNLNKLFALWADFQSGETPNVEFIPVDVGETFDLGALGHKGWSVTPFPTPHRIPSQGYILSETRWKLLPEFADLLPQEIGDLRRNGTVVSEQKTFNRLAYTGDTRVEVLDQVPELTTCDALIIESTFLGDEHTEEFACKRGHIHMKGIASRAAMFKNKVVLLVHFSARYDASMIVTEMNALRANFPVPIIHLPIA